MPIVFRQRKAAKTSGRFCILSTKARDVLSVASWQGVLAASVLHKSTTFKNTLLRQDLHFFTPFVGESRVLDFTSCTNVGLHSVGGDNIPLYGLPESTASTVKWRQNRLVFHERKIKFGYKI